MPSYPLGSSLNAPCLVFLVTLTAFPAMAGPTGGPPTCPANFVALGDNVESLLCRCDPNDADLQGSVWGTGIYTQDSSICRAAEHAGAIDPGSRTVVVQATSGCDSYAGTVRNGVTTSSWGPYKTSFFFPQFGDGSCSPLPKDACPGTFAAAEARKALSCTCYPEQLTGAVWGTDIYTQDSSVCVAAQHSGVIDSKGGKVEARQADGCQAYTGSTRNGVQTSSWGPYERSFLFAGSQATCAPPEAIPCPQSFAGGGKKETGEKLECTCRPGPYKGAVWGSGIYTQDSNVCAAAAHAGVITASGGVISALAQEGCEAFVGTQANGVESRSWGPYGSSFVFPLLGKTGCPNIPTDACPTTFKAAKGAALGAEISCTCLPNVTDTVWGTGLYTADSTICAAARHAGAVSDKGGTVTLRGVAGCTSYPGTEAHGISSSKWGSYDLSFTFPGFGDGACK